MLTCSPLADYSRLSCPQCSTIMDRRLETINADPPITHVYILAPNKESMYFSFHLLEHTAYIPWKAGQSLCRALNSHVRCLSIFYNHMSGH